MKKTILSSLRVIARPEKSNTPSIDSKRLKLIKRLEQQKELAICRAANKPFTVTKDKWETDKQTGERTRVRREVAVRPWFYDNNGHYFLEVKVGIKTIELEKGKHAIEVGALEKLPDIIETVIRAVEAGELDRYLTLPTSSPKVNGTLSLNKAKTLATSSS